MPQLNFDASNVDPSQPFEAIPSDKDLVELILGTTEDAQWESIGANKSHGLRHTNEDKRNAVKQALLHPKGIKESNRKIAEHVGVAEGTVRVIRHELELTAQIAPSNSRTGRDGRTINTSRIGFGKTPPPPGAKCMKCVCYENNRCTNDDPPKLPWDAACEDFGSMNQKRIVLFSIMAATSCGMARSTPC